MFMALMVLTGGEDGGFGLTTSTASSAPAVRQHWASVKLSLINHQIAMHKLQSRSRRSQPSEPRDFLLAGFVADRTCATWHENGQHVIVQAHAWVDTKRTTFQLEYLPLKGLQLGEWREA
ncbi:hypothetical protein E4U09_002302 [Claviceps aff. purpurea]|uniref:Uncharacterized protein n=1 Tax=Claviceps aff. purpurea TaxID=1967640 RepID=A0A9P7QNV2_9HYPO|nr:hypothetical protein E4U09_002302 [Claviceps aff. purpurea]